jgi:selenocysteine lyase/cysteine desulfurase
LERLREQFSRLLRADSSEICLVANTTTGINLIAEGWPWQKGDSVVIPEGEFPSNLFPWQNQRSRGVELRVVPRRDGEVRIEDLMERVDVSTRLIAVSWVGYGSAARKSQQAHRRGERAGAGGR